MPIIVVLIALAGFAVFPLLTSILLFLAVPVAALPLLALAAARQGIARLCRVEDPPVPGQSAVPRQRVEPRLSLRNIKMTDRLDSGR